MIDQLWLHDLLKLTSQKMMEVFDLIPSQEFSEVWLPIVQAIHDFLLVLGPTGFDHANVVAAE
jgi:hypothetical protein